jgi:hypothetical protein
MISSQEFYQKLHAGQIHQALALIIQESIELDITTQMTEDLANNRSSSSEYLRTKINLLTGDVQNEVGESVITDSSNYFRLKKLHLDQVVASHRLIHDYLQQIQEILAILPATPSVDVSPDVTNSHNPPLVTATAPTEHQSSGESDLDDDLDLSVDRDGEVWEECVEDEDFRFGAGVPQPPSASLSLTLPDRAEHSVPRQLNPIAVKPIVPRSASPPVDTSATWDKFAPECIEIVTESQPRINNHSDAHQMDQLLADLDI